MRYAVPVWDEALALELYAVADRLLPFASDPAPLFWVGGDHGGGEAFCEACCERAVEEVHAKHGAGDPGDPLAWIDGGWSANEEGHSPACSSCGRQLAYRLTDYGVREELSHWSEHPLHLDDHSEADCTYEVLRLVEGVYATRENGDAAQVLDLGNALASRLEAEAGA